MKVSNENYNQIKLAFEIWLQNNTFGVTIDSMTIGEFCKIHDAIHRSFKKQSVDPYNQTGCLFDPNGVFALEYYPDYYPNDCNDSHLDAVFNKLKREIKQ